MAHFSKDEMLERVADALKSPAVWREDATAKHAQLGALVVELVETGDPLEARLGVGFHILLGEEPVAMIASTDPNYSARKAALAAIGAKKSVTDPEVLQQYTDQIVHEINARLPKVEG